MSSSNDEIPLAQRATRALNIIDLDSDDDSVPSWLADHKSPAPQRLPSSTDSSDIEEVTASAQPETTAQQSSECRELREELQHTQQQPPSQEPSQQPPSQEPSPQRQKGRRQKRLATRDVTPKVEKSYVRDAVAQEPAGPYSQPPASQPSTSQPSISQPTPAQQKLPGAALSAPSNQLPMMLPEKFPQMKVLVELESVEGGATDLAGDAGAVGRVLITGVTGDQQLQIDLKGVLYTATIVPCPITMAVVNIGQAEAKVECLFTEFLQLREDTRFSCHDSRPLDTLLADDQEDNYMLGGGAANKGGEEDGATATVAAKKGGGGGRGRKKTAEKKGKAGAARGRKVAAGASKALKKTAGGVKKPRMNTGASRGPAAGRATKAKPKPKGKVGGATKKK